MEAKDRSTTEVPRGFGQISPLVSRVIMMARLLLVVTSRQGVCRASTTRPPRQRLRVQIRSGGTTVTYADATANQMTQHLDSAPAAQQSWTNQKIKSDGIRHACSGGGDRLYVGIFCLGKRWCEELSLAIQYSYCTVWPCALQKGMSRHGTRHWRQRLRRWRGEPSTKGWPSV